MITSMSWILALQPEILGHGISPQYVHNAPAEEQDEDKLYGRVDIVVGLQNRMQEVGAVHSLYDYVVHDIDAHATRVKTL